MYGVELLRVLEESECTIVAEISLKNWRWFQFSMASVFSIFVSVFSISCGGQMRSQEHLCLRFRSIPCEET